VEGKLATKTVCVPAGNPVTVPDTGTAVWFDATTTGTLAAIVVWPSDTAEPPTWATLTDSLEVSETIQGTVFGVLPGWTVHVPDCVTADVEGSETVPVMLWIAPEAGVDVTLPETVCVLGNDATNTVCVDGRFETATVPLTGCVLGNDETKTVGDGEIATVPATVCVPEGVVVTVPDTVTVEATDTPPVID
jgi:hypothetical protein